MSTVIQVENLSKQYRLGQVGTGTLADDLNRWWCRLRGKEDPFLKIGQINDRSKKSENGNGKSGNRSLLSAFKIPAFDSPELVWALKDINFEVKQGEVLGIIGRNGAGKSTLLKILSRVTTPTTGQVKVNGRIASLLEVGTGFHPDLSGRENIYLNGAILGMRKQEITHKLDEIIDFSGCERYIDTPVKRYSSGMYVRLAFAVAAHLDPEILIIDEILAVGDAEFQNKCLGKIQDVARGGRTVLFVSHNLAAVERLCSRTIVLSKGCIAYSGEAYAAVKEYIGRISPKQDANRSLQTDVNRSGAGNIRIRSVSFIDDEGDETVAFPSGSPMTIQFACENTTQYAIENVIIGYSLYTKRGELLAIQYSDYEDRQFTLPSGLSRIATRIPLLPIATGRYSLGGRVLVEGLEEDCPKYSLGTVTIEGGDYGGNDKLPHSGRGAMLLANEWSIHTHPQSRNPTTSQATNR